MAMQGAAAQAPLITIFGMYAQMGSHAGSQRRAELGGECCALPQGRLVVYAGTEGFQSEMGPWSVLGSKSLGTDPYVPDFDAFASGGCRLMRIHADAYRGALRMGKADKIVGVRAMRQLSQVLRCSSRWPGRQHCGWHLTCSLQEARTG